MRIALGRGRWPVIPVLATTAGLMALFSPFNAIAGRPLVIDDAAPVEHGHVELELGVAHSRPHNGGREQNWPVMSLSYGAVKNLEVGLAIERVNNDPRGESSVQGFEDLHISLKYRFLKQWTYRPALAFSFGLKLPTANRRKDLSSGRVDQNILLVASWSSSHLALDGNLGYFIVDSPPRENLKNRILGGLALRVPIDPQWTLVGEIFGQSRAARSNENEGEFRLGAQWSLRNNVVLDAAVGRSLRRTGREILAIAGLTWSFATGP